MTSLFELYELEDQVELPANNELEQSNFTVLNGTDGDDTIDINFVDSDGDTMSQSYDIYAGAGDDYIEVDGILQGGYYGRNIWLGEGADTLNFVPEKDHEYIDIFDFKAEDTIQLNGVTLNWSTFNELDFTYDEFGSGFVLWNGQADIYFHDTTLEAVLGERGAVDGTSEADLIDSAFVDVDGDVLFDGGNEVIAGQGNDTVIAGSGDDTIFGISGNNIIDGGGGDDVIHTGQDASEIDGGEGQDTIYADLSEGADHVIHYGSRDMLRFENVSDNSESHVTIKGWSSTIQDELYINDQEIFIDYSTDDIWSSITVNENFDPVLYYGDNTSFTFEGAELQLLFNVYPMDDGAWLGTDGDDWMDASYIDHNYDTLDSAGWTHPGAGNDYVEMLVNETYVYLESGSDTFNIILDDEVSYFAGIRGVEGDDILQINGQDLTLDLLQDLGFEIQSGFSDYNITLYNSSEEFDINIKGSDFHFLREYHEGLNGTDGDDLITVEYTSLDHEINAGKGRDTVVAGDGDDTIYGVSGSNVIDGGNGDDQIHTGRHTSEIDAGYGSDTIYADLSKGADHVVDLGEYDWDQDELHLENVSLDRESHVTVKGWDTYDDQLYIGGSSVAFEDLSDGMTFSLNEDADAVLLFGDDDTLTFSNSSIYDLIVF